MGPTEAPKPAVIETAMPTVGLPEMAPPMPVPDALAQQVEATPNSHDAVVGLDKGWSTIDTTSDTGLQPPTGAEVTPPPFDPNATVESAAPVTEAPVAPVTPEASDAASAPAPTQEANGAPPTEAVAPAATTGPEDASPTAPATPEDPTSAPPTEAAVGPGGPSGPEGEIDSATTEDAGETTPAGTESGTVAAGSTEANPELDPDGTTPFPTVENPDGTTPFPDAETVTPEMQQQNPERQALVDERQKLIDNIKGGADTPENRKQLNTLNEKISKDPATEIEALKKKQLEGGVLTSDELAKVNGETESLTTEQQADKMIKDLENLSEKMLNKMMSGEDATEEVMELAQKLNESHGIRQDVTQQDIAREFVKGIFDKDTKGLSSKESEKRRDIREKLQVLAKKQIELMQLRETIKQLQKMDKAKEKEVQEAEDKMRNPKDSPEEQYAKQMDWSAKTLQMAEIQERIVRTRNMGKMAKADFLLTKSYVHRRLGMNNIMSQVVESTYAAGYAAYAGAVADIDF